MKKESKELHFYSEVEPLMREVIKICERHSIPMFSHFRLDIRDDGKVECVTFALTNSKDDYLAIQPMVKYVGIEE